MGDLRQHQKQKTKATENPSSTVARKSTTAPTESPELSLGNKALGHWLQARQQERSAPTAANRPSFKGLSQELQVHPKLKLTQPGDRQEREADRTAARVVQHLNAPNQHNSQPAVMPKWAASPATSKEAIAPPLEAAIQQERGRGDPISKEVREPLEQAFGTDFSPVRIHTDGKADQLNRSINSVAFTTGKDIFFKQGAYQPRSRNGQTLLAHELTHIWQQNPLKSTIQRKDATVPSQTPTQSSETTALVNEVAQEIKSFSADWLDSPPNHFELFPGVTVTVKSLGLKGTNHNILEIHGGLELKLGSEITGVEPKGKLKISYDCQSQNWDYNTQNIQLKATIADILTLDAKDIKCDRQNLALTVATTTLKIPDFGKTQATAKKVRIDQSGVDWDSAALNLKEIGVGEVINLQNFKANLGGKSKNYKAELNGKLGLNIGDKNVADVQAEGQFKILHNGNNQWDYDTKNINLTANIAEIFKLDANNIEYDRKKSQLNIQKTTLTIPELKNTKATVNKAKIDPNGVDWDRVTVTVDDTSIGDFFTVRKPKLVINGRQSDYSSVASGSVELKLGQYFKGTGKGAIALNPKNATSAKKLKINSLELTASGNVQFSGDLMVWPQVNFSYPVVPGAVETGISLKVGGSIGASLTGSVKKGVAEEDLTVAVNPEIKGSLFSTLKGYAGLGSSYIAAVDAFLKGKCTAIATGGLKINGKLGYNSDTQKIDISQLLSEYYAKADFKVAISAGLQATALYFFEKNLYRIRGELSLGGGSMKGKLEFDNNGSFQIGKPEFEGILAGKLDKESIKLERSYDVVDTSTAEKLLQDATKNIPGSGKERKRIITEVRASYIRVLEQTKNVIDREQDKSNRYAKKLELLDVKLSRYKELAKLASELEINDTKIAQIDENINNEQEEEKLQLEQQQQSEIASLEQQQAEEEKDIDRQEQAEKKRSALKKVKGIANSITKKYKKLRDKVAEKYYFLKSHIPDKYQQKYDDLKQTYQQKKTKLSNDLKSKQDELKDTIHHKKDELKEKSYDLKQRSKQNFSGTIETLSVAKLEVSGLKTKASSFKNQIKEYVKDKTLTKLTEIGIKNAESFVQRMNELAELQEKYTNKYQLHQDCLDSAIATKNDATRVIEDVNLAIEDLKQLELGRGVEKISRMNYSKISLNAIEGKFERETVKLEDNLNEQVENIEKEILDQSS
ncbi:DUF4157 domain-containing protein [Spirulina sp. CS-785/01]|uniref:eCIS core domain-containing protein n=1 Tax=Spirulina sp. CS-785/01 TaxID=3021716 RepID=UPI002330866C|nr:DUF4157 domain-containing protein [Spirulina sp. CS-785/01]MDB9315301.1 DUF4157 domain-containing protein [Spirulina sp. CS-785/01]